MEDSVHHMAWDIAQAAERHSTSPIPMAVHHVSTHEIERQGRWKQGGGMVDCCTRGESAGSALRYL